MADWNPELYNRFRDYRAEPFNWILTRLPLSHKESIVDLGCGTGENTIELARRCAEGVVTGIDSSPAMLARAQELRRRLPPDLASRISFTQADFRQLESDREYSIIFSNAALQWASDHREVLLHWYRALQPEGRIIVQMPANHYETAQLTLSELARESRWRSAMSRYRHIGSALQKIIVRCLKRSVLKRLIAITTFFNIPWRVPPRLSSSAARLPCVLSWNDLLPSNSPRSSKNSPIGWNRHTARAGR